MLERVPTQICKHTGLKTGKTQEMTRQAENMDKNQGMTRQAEKSRERPDRLKNWGNDQTG